MFLRVFLIKVQFYLHGRDREKIISLSLLILIKNREKVKVQISIKCHKRWYYHVFTTLLGKSLVLLTWKRIV